MIVKSLELNHFRNYTNLEIDFEAGTNILYGDKRREKRYFRSHLSEWNNKIP